MPTRALAPGGRRRKERAMPAAEKQLLLEALREGRQALARALAGVDEGLVAETPATGRWSILECLNHLVESEQNLLARLRKAGPGGEAVASPEREAKIAARARDRTPFIAAPAEVWPRGCYESLAEALAALDRTRQDVIGFLEQSDQDLRALATDHPLIKGPVTCYETLVMIAAHPRRHAEQILEIRNTLENRRRLHSQTGCCPSALTPDHRRLRLIPMEFPVSELEKEPIEFDLQLEPGAVDLGDEANQNGPLSTSGRAEVLHEHRGPREIVADIRLRGRYSGRFRVPCARCVEPVEVPLAADFDLI